MLPELLIRLMSDPRCLWSMGGPGSVLALRGSGLGTAGALRLSPHPQLRLIAFEVLSADPESWNHAIALCLPSRELLDPAATREFHASDDTRSGAVTAVNAHSAQIRLFVRDRGNRSDWVAQGPLGRMEVWDQRGLPPVGPIWRTHPATSPIPAGLVPFAHVVPAHPMRNSPGRPKDFDIADHRAFQAMFTDHGRADLVALKAETLSALREGRALPVKTGRNARTQLRVALRQERQIAPSTYLDYLIARHDRALARHLDLTPVD